MEQRLKNNTENYNIYPSIEISKKNKSNLSDIITFF